MHELYFYLILALTGVVAGVINTMAGGGSNLTIPALMLMGMPADIANATNRVGVLLQCAVGVRGFRKAGMMPGGDARGIVRLTMTGGLAGAAAASLMPNLYLKPVMLAAITGMALLILIRPALVVPPVGTPEARLAQTPASWPILLLAGFYGGFVQAGVGFILLGAIAGSLRYDFVRANALKLMCTLVFTACAVVVFALHNQIQWLPGLALAAGTMTGAQLSVRIATRISAKTMKWFLFVMTAVACGAALLGG